MFYCVIWVWFISEWFGVILFRSGLVWVVLFLVWFGFLWCGLVWFLHLLVLSDVLLCSLGVIWFWMSWCDIIDVRLGLSSFIFSMICCLLVCFGVICIFFYWKSMFLVWFGCDLFLNDLVWYYWGQFRSELVCFWCGLVSYGVVWCDFYIFGY